MVFKEKDEAMPMAKLMATIPTDQEEERLNPSVGSDSNSWFAIDSTASFVATGSSYSCLHMTFLKIPHHCSSNVRVSGCTDSEDRLGALTSS